MGDSDSGGGGWVKWIIGILVTLAVGVFVPVYLANRGSSPTPAAQTNPITTTGTARPSLVIPNLPEDFTKPARLFVNKTSGPAGSTVTLSGDGFKPGEEVVFSMQTMEVGRTTADQAGAFAQVSVTVPKSLGVFAPHQFSFDANGQESIKHASIPFVVSG